MQEAKKPSPDAGPTRDMLRELQTLYARRSTIDALIESLQAYERYSDKGVELPRPKMA